MNHLQEYSPFQFNQDQQIAAGLLEKFIDDPIDRVFVLKGHAGTGKTTLLDALIKYVEAKKLPVVLLASTGRAAKIIGEKARHNAETVHKHIYILDVDHADDENKIRRLIFRLRVNQYPEQTLYIVDECSMISDRETSGVFIDFGSGRLLTDFFTYCGPRKVIFSGDSCQLPPVNALFSPALSSTYLKEKHHKTVKEAKLTEVMRFDKGSGIYFNTTLLRDSIESGSFGRLQIQVSGFADLHIKFNEDLLIEDYIKSIKSHGLDDSALLTFSNAKAADANRQVRRYLFPGKDTLVRNESLMVVQNNYKFDIANGEHIFVTEIESVKEHRAGMTFLTVTAQVKDAMGTMMIQGKLIEDLLYAKEPGLTGEQEYELYKDFMIRLKKKGIKPKDEEFLMELLTDPYLNAIRAKFGYAFTCHKAQGGEWAHVFIMLERSLFNPNFEKESVYRWAYTAISRGMRHVHFLDNYCLK